MMSSNFLTFSFSRSSWSSVEAAFGSAGLVLPAASDPAFGSVDLLVPAVSEPAFGSVDLLVPVVSEPAFEPAVLATVPPSPSDLANARLLLPLRNRTDSARAMANNPRGEESSVVSLLPRKLIFFTYGRPPNV